MRIYARIYAYICAYTHIYAHIYAYTHIYAYICAYIRAYYCFTDLRCCQSQCFFFGLFLLPSLLMLPEESHCLFCGNHFSRFFCRKGACIRTYIRTYMRIYARPTKPKSRLINLELAVNMPVMHH